ncbi:carbohydrate kinase family protein [Saliphagus infecundisoli]|uniref:Carbohydrate kinase family protein n=1 Tax=Saliphagus infecundisoli TaxID=1849069 RepID=A0ABD5QJW1_9EURY|nr:carbohydrate kinase family protein [Saliphagus infecundisoli]
MEEPLEVVSVGSALVDEEYLVSNLPEPDAGAYVHEESVGFGGVAANGAVGLSRLGHDTGVVVQLGNDDNADLVEANLREEGVSTARVRYDDEERSTYCMVFRDPDGERTIVTGGGAAKNLELTEADEAALRSAEVVFANGFCPDRVSRRLAELAADGEIRLVFDLASTLDELADRATERETIDDLLPHLALFVANEVSIDSYLGVRGEEAIEALRKRGVSRGALTSGEEGALLWDAEGVVEVSAFDVDVVDTTGAGDAFVCGLIHEWLLAGESAAEAGRFGAAAGAFNCTEQSARGGMVDDDRIRTFLAERS